MDEWRKGKGLVYEKELLPCGDFVKWISDDDEVPIRVREPFLKKLVADFQRFKEVGVKVPLFKTHHEDPDNKRGEIVDVSVKRNKAGIPALFGKVKFDDEKAATEGVKHEVSVMCPPRFKDGKGNAYDYPLRHVALTDKPVIPGMGEFVPMVMSFATPSGLAPASGPPAPPQAGGISAMIDQILQKLQITPPEGADDAAKLKLVLDKLAAGAPAGPAGPPAGPMNLSFPPVLVAQMRTARNGVIDRLQHEAVLTPAVAKEWREKYCTSAALEADLSLDEESGETEFDRMVDAAQKVAGQFKTERTARMRQGIKLSHGDDGKENALQRAMKRKREAAGVK